MTDQQCEMKYGFDQRSVWCSGKQYRSIIRTINWLKMMVPGLAKFCPTRWCVRIKSLNIV